MWIYGGASVATAILYSYILYYQSKNASQGALAMHSMGMAHIGKFWSFPILQATGMVGLITAYIAILFGLQQSSRVISLTRMSPKEIDVVHRTLSLATLGLVVLHTVATAFDAMGDSWRTVLWFNGWAKNWPQASWAYNIGILSAYLLIILGPTYYLRSYSGVARWKFLHRFIIIFYILAFWHSLILGTDMDGYKWVRPIAWALQLPLLWLFARRMSELAKKNAAHRGRRVFLWALMVLMYGGAAAVIVLLLLGKWGFIAAQ